MRPETFKCLFAILFAAGFTACAFARLDEASAITKLGQSYQDAVHDAIATFIEDSVQTFELTQPLQAGQVMLYSGNGWPLIQLGGSLSLELVEPRRPALKSVEVHLNWGGTGPTPQIKLSVQAFGVVLSGRHTLSGNLGGNLTIGGDGGLFTIFLPVDNPLNASCSIRAQTTEAGYLQLGDGQDNGCYSTTGEISLIGNGAYAEFTPPLVNSTGSSLEPDLNAYALRMVDRIFPATVGRQLGEALMQSLARHLQGDFNMTKVLDIISGAAKAPQSHRNNGPPAGAIGRDAPKRGSGNGQLGTLKNKLDTFARSTIASYLNSPSFNPYLPPGGVEINISATKPIVKVGTGRVWNVAYGGIVNTSVVVDSCYDCGTNVDIDLRIDLFGGELFGDFELEGNATAEYPFATRGTFSLKHVSASFWMIPKFYVQDGSFKFSLSNKRAASFSQAGGEDAVQFIPELLAGLGDQFPESVKAYVDQVVGTIIVDQLGSYSGYVEGIQDAIIEELKRVFLATPPLEVILD